MRELKYRLTTLQDVKENISFLLPQPLAFDIETKGLYGEIRLAQFYQEDWEEALLVENPEIIELQALLKQCHIICHNISYEVSTIQTQLGKLFDQPLKYWVPKEWDDTLLLAKLQWYKKEKHTLDACYSYAFNYDVYLAHNINKKDMQDAWGKGIKPTEKMYAYGAIDVFYLIDLYNKCKDWKKTTVSALDYAATTAAFEFQCNGMPLNPERAQALLAKNMKELAALNVPINVNSWQQVRPFIGEDESDGLSLATFALEGNHRAELVNRARKLLKLNSFLNKFLDTAYENRIYGKFTFTTKSGRGNCKDQNLQQLPRKSKEVFEAGPGKILVMADYSQLELRYGCAFTGETHMAKFFKQGVDLHQKTADAMSVPRQQAKTCNFNLLYLGSAKMLRSIFIKDADLLLPLSDVSTLKNKWHILWPILTEWQQEVIKAWQQGLHQESALGRKMFTKLFTDAANLPISSGSADIAKLAMHRMVTAVKADKELAEVAKLCNFVHDNFIYECPNDPKYYIPLAEIIAKSMHSSWVELVQYTKIPDLPMPVSVIVGKNWGDLESKTEKPTYEFKYATVTTKT